MSRNRTTILLGAVALAALGLFARPAAAGEFTVGAGYWDTKDADNALGVSTKLTLGRYFELRGSYFSDVTADTSPESTDFEIKAIPVEAGLAWHFTPEDAPFRPYVGGGASYIFLDSTAGQIDDEVGWYAVVGGDFARHSKLGFNVEAIYRSVDATVHENRHGLPGEVVGSTHLDLSGLGANAGLVWRF
jgi:hypothetical protein